MKRIQLFFTIFIISFVGVFHLSAQNYKVLKTKGTIKVNGKALKQGSSFTMKSSDKISFLPSSAAAMVFSNAQGVGALFDRVTKQTKTIKDLVEGQVKAFFQLSKKVAATRAGDMVICLDIEKHFGKARYLVLGSEIRLKISPTNFPMNDEKFFIVSYNYEGEDEEISKMLSFEGDSLIFNRDEVYKIDGQAIDAEKVSNFTFAYYQDAAEETSCIVDFHPVFPKNEDLVTELQLLVDAMKQQNKSTDEMVTEIGTYLSDVYGKPDHDNLKLWLASHLKM